MNLTGEKVYEKGKQRRRLKSDAVREDEEFLAWLRRQPSCLSGRYNEYVNGEGRCVAAHVSRIAQGKGIATKPLLSAVPLTQDEHLLQSIHGYEYYYPKQWWDDMVRHYVHQWRIHGNRG